MWNYQRVNPIASHWTTIVLWFSYDFPIFTWVSHGFPHFPMVFLVFLYGSYVQWWKVFAQWPSSFRPRRPSPRMGIWQILKSTRWRSLQVGILKNNETYFSQLGWWHSQLNGKIWKNTIHVPNHQRDIYGPFFRVTMDEHMVQWLHARILELPLTTMGHEWDMIWLRY